MKLPVLMSALTVCAITGHAAQPMPHDANALTAAHAAWAEGDYIAALNRYIAILNAPGGDAHLTEIALQTGELYRSTELTTDGRNPRFSRDGRHLAYDVGLEVSRRTKVLRNDSTTAVVADLPGVSATFSPTAAVVAYLKIGESPELTAAANAVDAAPLAGQNRGGLVQALNWQVVRNAAI